MRGRTPSRSTQWCLSAAPTWTRTSAQSVKFNPTWTVFSVSASALSLSTRSGRGINPEVDHRDAGGRAVDPPRERDRQHQRVEKTVHVDAACLCHGGIATGAGGEMRGTPDEPRGRQQEDRDADPLVPAVPAELLRTERQIDHRKPERHVARDQQRREPSAARSRSSCSVAGGVAGAVEKVGAFIEDLGGPAASSAASRHRPRDAAVRPSYN